MSKKLGYFIVRVIGTHNVPFNSMQTLLDYSLNRHLNNNANGKIIECGIGIDYGKILVTKAGMYGIESDESKENEMSFIWVGNTTNHASKYADLTDGGEIFISEMAYTKLSSDLKKFSWSSITKFKGIKSYNGYSIHDFYLDFKENLGTPLKIESDNESHKDNAVQLSDGIKIISELQDKLFNKERNLAINEVNLKKENETFRQVQYELDGILYDIIHSAFMDESIVKKDDIKYWLFVIDNYYIIEKCLGRSKADTRIGISYCLSPIYDRLGLYKESFEEMSYMANNTSWINMHSATLNWAKEKGMIWDIRYDINRRIESDSSIDRQSFQSYYDEVDKYYG